MAGVDDAGRMQQPLPISGRHLQNDRSRIRPGDTRRGARTAPRTPAARGARQSRRRIGPADVAMLTYDLAMLLGAGLPLLQALEVLADQTIEVRLREVLREVAREIRGGRRFSEALGRYPEFFSPLYRGIVTNGEASGRLDQALERLAAFLERDLEFRKKVRDVLIYPAMVLTMAGVVLYVLPLVAFFAFAQRFIVRGIVTTGIKG